MQEPINYIDVINIDFEVEDGGCSSFFEQFGYPYKIITKNLTKKIYLIWDQETRFVEMHRIDSNKPNMHNIKSKYKVKNIEELKKIIEFFID